MPDKINSQQKKALEDLLKAQKNQAKKIRSEFIDATDDLADVVGGGIQLQRSGRIIWDSETENLINEQLSASAKSVRLKTNEITRYSVDNLVTASLVLNEEITLDYMSMLNPDIIKQIYKQTKNYIVDIQFKKTWKSATTGYSETWSSSVWRVGRRYREDMQTLIKHGLDLGRSPEVIAKDLEVYVRDSSQSIAKRYGTLDQSSKRLFETEEEYKERIKQFKRRIPKNVDYRALRLARSTLQGAVQDAGIAMAEINPAIRQFNWNLSPAHYLPSICDDIAPGSPYTYETFGYGNPPHPNCQSFITYITVEPKQFVEDLKEWDKSGGTRPPYLRGWKSRYYDAIERGQTIEFPLLLSRQSQ